MRIANVNARAYVTARAPFQGNNLYGLKGSRGYAVFSYGRHWPLYIFRRGRWYENADRTSVTTSKHLSQTRPTGAETTLKTLRQMLDIDIGL